jgi:hypothetical protein
LIKKLLSSALCRFSPYSAWPPPTPVSAQEIANRTLAAYPQVDSVKMDMNMSMDVDGVGGDEPFSMSIATSGSAVIDNAARQMQMSMTMSMEANTNAESELGSLGDLTMSYDTYIVDDWMYYHVSMILLGDYWMKAPATDDDNVWQNQNQLTQQAEFLRDAMEMTRVGEEAVGGVDCYVLEYRPDMEKIMEWLMSQGAETGMDMEEFEDMPDAFTQMFQDLTIKQWIAKGSYQIMKTAMDMDAELSEKDFDPAATSDEAIKMSLHYEVLFYDYNVPVTISLPPEALTAQEATSLY